MSSEDYKKLFRLENKTVVLTGATGILGKAFAQGLAQHGARLALVDLDQSSLDAFAQDLSENYDVMVKGYACDISNAKSVRETVSKIAKDFSTIDVLHNNAASKSEDLDAFFAPFEDYSLEEWRKIMSVNIDGYFLMAQAVGKKMLEQGFGGSIIQTSSVYGVVAPDQRIYEGSSYLGRKINTPAVYSVSKSAVIGLTKYLASYWGAAKIRVNTLTPGGNESGQNDEFKKLYSARVPLGRMGHPPEMVGALLYLASDASKYVTGQNIVVDGGLSVW